ncbi:tetratricopeptide repeat protein [Kosakonia cowanii]|uniref:O-linked N-acetylglucosamine transferase, SPINDLY family protein n=1 Tax=Kosakonia cowanii TaxID=208223 RepID=UPI0023FA26D8|nr:glycosyltransferase family 41 protein [Kosakonia cowanii]MDF7760126.1 tetratricopeptide repeat protein [Kosakonia cowanii]
MKQRLTWPAAPKKTTTAYKSKTEQVLAYLSDQPEKALEIAQKLVIQNKNDPFLLLLIGKAYQKMGNFPQAEKNYNHALELNKYYEDAIHARVDLLDQNERYDEAATVLNDAIASLGKSKSLGLRAFLASTLLKQKKYEQAVELYKELLEEEPGNWLHWNNLGMIYQDQSLFDDMDLAFIEAAKYTTDDPIPFYNRIVGAHYNPKFTAEEILAMCQEWQTKFAVRQKPRIEARNKDKNKRIRIGMISDGFRLHPVGNMITLALSGVPASQLEFYAYSTNFRNDHITQRIKRFCTKWMVVENYSVDKLDSIIREDEIDILLDLSGYNSNSCMRNFQLAPAPVQIKWVGGLISSTGLQTMDYLISDNIETPEGSDTLYTEKLIRMPNDYICYDPPVYLPALADNPVKRNGYFTFGCFNNATKINDVLLQQWSVIMHAVPDSRLFLKSFNFENEGLQARVLSQLEAYGISRERVRIEGSSAHKDLLACYNDVDIALDPWPYSGGLTTCEAMIMGVPVVTLPGPTFAGRHSATHLTNAGMQELVAENWEHYINIVVGLTQDLSSLTIIRQHLREILIKSPVCDGEKFALHFSNAMRAIWQRYCDGKAPEALTLTEDKGPQFLDEAEPVMLQQPEPGSVTLQKEGDEEFSFLLSGKIVTVDYGALFARSDRFVSLHATDALQTIIMDIAGNVRDDELPARKNDIFHTKLYIFGNGEPAKVNICLDPAYSSDLRPALELEGHKVVAEVVAHTEKLDDIESLQRVEWLIVNNRFNLRDLFTYGANKISQSLVLDIRMTFEPTHQGQMTYDEICSVLREMGFIFHSFNEIQYAEAGSKAMPDVLSPTQMVAANMLFIPGKEKLTALSAGQREKLGFIMHMAYSITDVAYSVLMMNDKERAAKFLSALNPHSEAMAEERADDEPAFLIPEMPRMSAEEREMFEKYLKKTKRYYEFGSGGSTKLATRHGVEVFGVESDKFWVETLRDEAGPLCNVDYVDIGPTKEWGYPIDETDNNKFPDYSEAIMRYENGFDVILIDGRFRVACTLNAIKHTLKHQPARQKTVIIIHDFWDRPNYHVVLRFLDVVDSAESLGVFKLKKKIDLKHLDELLEEYKYVTA